MVGKPKTAEMHVGPGFRIKMECERPDPATVAGFGAFETPGISDLTNRLYALDPAIRNLTDERLRLVGPACTVKVYPGDNLMVHKALDVAQRGDVIVVDTSGSMATAALGDLVSTKARHRGIAGFVVDGLIRELPGIRALGGVVVNPGDIIVGDATGVVVVPQAIAVDLLSRLTAAATREASYVAAVARGDF